MFTKLFSLNAGGNAVSAPGFQILNISICSGDIRAQSGKVSEIALNLACFSPPKYFWGHASKCLDRHL